MSETSQGDKHKDAVKKTKEYYEKSTELCKDLASYNVEKNTVALNFSTFYYDITQEKKKGYQTCVDALNNYHREKFYATKQELEDVQEIIRMIKDNMDFNDLQDE